MNEIVVYSLIAMVFVLYIGSALAINKLQEEINILRKKRVKR